MIRKLTFVREKEIERHLVKRCKERGWLCWKFVSPGLRGVPDRIVFRPGGKLHLPELKAPGEEPTPQQLRRHAELRERGFDVVTLSSVTEVDWWVDALA